MPDRKPHNSVVARQPGTIPRLLILDALRGIAIIGMVIYHAAWDLDFLGLAALSVATSAGWQWMAYCVAGTFLAVSGISLALMTHRRLRLLAFGQRLMLIAVCALVITIATRFLMPETYIYFGILHSIAVGSVICLLFARLPWAVAALAGIAVLWVGTTVTLPALGDPIWAWTGLQAAPPPASDFVPVFPWTGLMLLGMATGQILSRHTAIADTIAAVEPRRLPGRALIWLGRKSLIIYMLHQPLLIGVLMAVATLAGPGGPDGRSVGAIVDLTSPGQAMNTTQFLSSCETNCRDAGGGDLCTTYCRCVVTGLQDTELWESDGLSESEVMSDPRFLDVIETCQTGFQAPEPAPSQ